MIKFPKTKRGEIAYRCVHAVASHLWIYKKDEESRKVAVEGFKTLNYMHFGKEVDTESEFVVRARSFLRSFGKGIPCYAFQQALTAPPRLPK